MDDNEIKTAEDNNDDMTVGRQEGERISFKVNESPAPERKWTKKDKRAVWIIAVAITVIAVVAIFFIQSIDYNNFRLFG